ncbi:Uncharacterised protein [Escherichia coli]|uniref:Uncharacterized protein n=1 Tax=Escherichia coli TaxID=562 RepID=A0A376MU71_ECOLX|nr:Uncharacterised protein [Escherichia coli]
MFVDRQRIDLLNRLIDARVEPRRIRATEEGKRIHVRQRKQSSTR